MSPLYIDTQINRLVKILSELHTRTSKREQLVNWPFSLKSAQRFLPHFLFYQRKPTEHLETRRQESNKLKHIQN